jgi:hypothetical protein
MADPHGGKHAPGELVADTLEELRAMLPPGLTRWERSSAMSSQGGRGLGLSRHGQVGT